MERAAQIISGCLFVALTFYGCAAVAYPLARRWAGSHPATRWLATCLLACVFATLLFHGLLAVSLFRPLAAGIALAVSAAISWLVWGSPRELAVTMAIDYQRFLRTLRPGHIGMVHIALMAACVPVFLTAGRSLAQPPVGWDSMTYHWVKAGIWVQSGGPIALSAPGGWEIYRMRLGGGELFSAWGMLPFRGDLLAGAVDVFFWALCALAVLVLGAELGLRVRHRWAALIYSVFLPALWLPVGSGYVDGAATAFSLAGLAFGVACLRSWSAGHAFLSVVSMGLACGVKITLAPAAVAVSSVLLLSSLIARTPPSRRWMQTLAPFAWGVLLVLFLIAPWLVRNWLDVGYALGLPVSFGGIALGADLPALQWYRLGREIAPYELATELDVLSTLFGWPNQPGPHLSLLSLPLVLLAPVGLVALANRRASLGKVSVLVSCFLLALVGVLYSPTFSVVRILWKSSSSRFLLPAILVGILVAFIALPTRGRSRDALAAYLLVGAGIHVYFMTLPGVSPLGFRATLLVAGGLFVIALLLHLGISRRTSAGWIALAGALSMCLVTGLAVFRTPERRVDLLASSGHLHAFTKYWIEAPRHLDDAGSSHRIAVTAGALRNADHWFVYYLLGDRLQNELLYVPISNDGAIVPFGPDEDRRTRLGDYPSWHDRLLRERASHVMSFAPASVELGWMDRRPEAFSRVTGVDGLWGLYRLTESEPGRP